MSDIQERIAVAIKRISDGLAPMRIPVDHTDPDVVLADAGKEIERLQAELQGAQKELKKHLSSSIKYELVDGIRQLAQNALTSSGNVETLEIKNAELARQMAHLMDQIAIMGSALSYYATTRETYAEKAEGAWLVAEKALTNLPAEAEKLRRLVEAAEKIATESVTQGAVFDVAWENFLKAVRDLRGVG